MARTNRVSAARKVAGKCEKCLNVIGKGDPYKWVAVKLRGDHPSEKRIRCEGCEDWHDWEWNPSIGAQAKRIIHDTEETLRYHRVYDDEAGAEAIMAEAASEIEILASTRGVSAERTRRVFGDKNHKTQQLSGDAEGLRAWAARVRNWRCPPLPEPEMTDCSLCSAKRMDLDAGGDADCFECQGAGRYKPETPGEEQLDEWRQEVADDAMGVLDTCPI
jgi:hypothetical protein